MPRKREEIIDNELGEVSSSILPPSEPMQAEPPVTRMESLAPVPEVATPGPTLAEVLARLDSVERKNKMLEEIAGKSQVADWIDSNKNFSQKLVHFKVIKGKMVIGWKPTKNEVKKVNGTWVEDMKTELHFVDGSKEEVDQVEFTRATNKVVCKLIGINHQSGDATVELPDGSPLKISSSFLNA